MLGTDGEASPAQTLRVSRVVAGVLIAGLATFAVFVWLVTDRPPEPRAADEPLLLVAAVVLAAGVVASVVAGPLLAAAHRKRGRTDEVWSARAFFTATVMRSAVLEGPGFLCLIVYMLSGRPLALAGAAVAGLLMLAMFPTRAAFDRFRARIVEEVAAGSEPR